MPKMNESYEYENPLMEDDNFRSRQGLNNDFDRYIPPIPGDWDDVSQPRPAQPVEQVLNPSQFEQPKKEASTCAGCELMAKYLELVEKYAILAAKSDLSAPRTQAQQQRGKTRRR